MALTAISPNWNLTHGIKRLTYIYIYIYYTQRKLLFWKDFKHFRNDIPFQSKKPPSFVPVCVTNAKLSDASEIVHSLLIFPLRYFKVDVTMQIRFFQISTEKFDAVVDYKYRLSRTWCMSRNFFGIYNCCDFVLKSQHITEKLACILILSAQVSAQINFSQKKRAFGKLQKQKND